MRTYGQTIKQYGTEIGPTGGFGKLYIILTGSYTGNLISRLLKVTDFIINKWIPCLFLRIKHFILFKSIISNTYSFMFGIIFFSINGLIETRKQATKAYIAESFKFVVANSWIVLIVQFRGDVSSWIFLYIQTGIWQYYNDLFRRECLFVDESYQQILLRLSQNEIYRFHSNYRSKETSLRDYKSRGVMEEYGI